MVSFAYQGEPGAYSHRAILAIDPTTDAIPCQSFTDVFREVSAGKHDFGVVPVRNIAAGPVKGVAELIEQHPDIYIVDEYPMLIHHCLVAHPDHERLSVAYSHVQALTQCQHTLYALGLHQAAYGDTAGAVRMIKEKKLLNAAAVASKEAALEYGMKIIEDGIQDRVDNITTFLIIARK